MGEKGYGIRWKQRFQSFQIALGQLALFVDPKQLALYGYSAELTPREELGMVKAFELCYEQAWLTLQDLLEERGYVGAKGPNATLQQALQDGYLTDGDGWMDLFRSRKRTVHTYDQQTADQISAKIRERFFALFQALDERLRHEF